MSAQPLWGHPLYAPQRFSAQDLQTLPEDGNKYELYQGVSRRRKNIMAASPSAFLPICSHP